MADDKVKELAELAMAVDGADKWLLKHGVVTPMTHNRIVLTIRSLFPQVKNVEYYVNPDLRRLDLTLYVGFWTFWLGKKKKLLDAVFDILDNYLNDYEIKVKIRRFREGNSHESEEPSDFVTGNDSDDTVTSEGDSVESVDNGQDG